ncbi:DUF4260 domain-containing protein [Gracilibacillus oryzae]|uniref:DUF4260 domain-containing protein n=1 Tax=Gracilibacillus oryzae TaxID=1672701 RepID=A0A7C8GVK4_9BACI|nr:DUF4260 domain-containing protein [Gracilibacillus oryzae]KAB8138158.1 DUF4260 domain-containing protein [Gracilibacillus oryzae]
MKAQYLIRLENGLAFAACFFLYVNLNFSIWVFFLFLLVPDLSMLGYLFNHKAGAIIYNLGHSFIIPIFIGFSYWYFSKDYLLMISLIWLAHIFMDRLFGFGLKYNHSFKITHIQKI